MTFNQIATRDIPSLVKAIKSETEDPEEILRELTLIDDLLTLQNSTSLLTRKAGLRKHACWS